MKTYRAALIGCSRMGAFIDNEVAQYPAVKLPYSHAAGYEACDRTDLVACSDLRAEVMAQVGERYRVPGEAQYTDYAKMLEEVQPDIVSVATQPEHRAEIVIAAAEAGARAIYAEKAFAASMAQTDAMVAAVERNGAILNLGTNRRWHTGFDAMKAAIDRGDIGELRSLIIYGNGNLFNTSSHNFDLIFRMNNDAAVSWVQATLPGQPESFENDILTVDPQGEGIIQFENGVKGYALNTPRGIEWEAIGSAGSVTARKNGMEFLLRKPSAIGDRKMGLDEGTLLEFELRSSTLRLIQDLVHALDTGEPPRGGVQVARANSELIFGFIESHLRGGARVPFPLKGSTITLNTSHGPRQPRFVA